MKVWSGEPVRTRRPVRCWYSSWVMPAKRIGSSSSGGKIRSSRRSPDRAGQRAAVGVVGPALDQGSGPIDHAADIIHAIDDVVVGPGVGGFYEGVGVHHQQPLIDVAYDVDGIVAGGTPVGAGMTGYMDVSGWVDLSEVPLFAGRLVAP